MPGFIPMFLHDVSLLHDVFLQCSSKFILNFDSYRLLRFLRYPSIDRWLRSVHFERQDGEKSHDELRARARDVKKGRLLTVHEAREWLQEKNPGGWDRDPRSAWNGDWGTGTPKPDIR
jgi:hypothetical protein